MIAAVAAPGEAGPLPVVIDDALTGQPSLVVEQVLTLLGELSSLSPSAQLVYLSDDEMVTAWAEHSAVLVPISG